MAKTGSASKIHRGEEQKDRVTENLSHPACFLNLPFDRSYDDILIAYITALLALGIIPTILTLDTSESPRLSKLIAALQSTSLSIHDLSWDETGDVRYNMPFELGLAIGISKYSDHTVIVFDSQPYRLHQRLSDYGGFDPWVHENSASGVLRELLNRFWAKNPIALENLEVLYQRARTWRASQSGRLQEAAVFRRTIDAIGEIIDLESKNTNANIPSA